MFTVRKAAERGHTRIGWLDSWHSFAFGDYFDPRHVGFRSLRVLNDDRVAAGSGFGMHPHRDMEILTWVLEGALQHRDSLGSGGVLRPGDLQLMTAGTGILHSETNPSPAEPVHFLQIWIVPEKTGLKPDYDQRNFPASDRRGRLRLVASRTPGDGIVTVRQDVDVYATLLDHGKLVTHPLRPGRHAWMQVASGSVRLNDVPFGPGDGAAISNTPELVLVADGAAEVLLFDLA